VVEQHGARGVALPLCRPIEAFSIVCAILLSLGVVSLAEGLVKGDMTGIMGFGLA
jgi:hypothetical protein